MVTFNKYIYIALRHTRYTFVELPVSARETTSVAIWRLTASASSAFVQEVLFVTHQSSSNHPGSIQVKVGPVICILYAWKYNVETNGLDWMSSVPSQDEPPPLSQHL